MLEPGNRFMTIVLAAGSVVLLTAIGIGERMGDRVLGDAAAQQLQAAPTVTTSPSAAPSSGPYGPDWKRSETISAAGDPHFPDPRVPPQPLPTPLPTPKPVPVTPTPFVAPTPTLRPNIPIWRQQPIPTASPTPAAAQSPSPTPSASPGLRVGNPDMIDAWKTPEPLP